MIVEGDESENLIPINYNMGMATHQEVKDAHQYRTENREVLKTSLDVCRKGKGSWVLLDR